MYTSEKSARAARIAEAILKRYEPTHVRLTRPDIGGAGYYIPLASLRTGHHGWFEELENNDIGDQLMIEFVHMTDEEYDALPEFTGW